MPHKDAARQKVAVWRLAPLKFRMVRVHLLHPKIKATSHFECLKKDT